MRCQPFLEWMDKEAGDRVTQLTGCPPTCDHGPKMLWWKNEQPEIYRQTAKFVMPGTYVAGKIAGLKADQAFIDHTYIHFSSFSEAQKTIWSDELCERFGLDMDKLPKIIDPCEVVGEVSESSAKEFGLAPGTLIAAGAGDTAANALGAGIVRPGMLFDVAGTAGESDGGGTQVLYLSKAGVSFDKLGLPNLGSEPVADIQQTIQHGLYQGAIAPVALLAVFAAAVWRSKRSGPGEEVER